VQGDRFLTQVGAPGRPTLLQRWRDEFAPEDANRLEAFLRNRIIPVRNPYVFLTATKS
jgi:hypothetical protein